MWADAQRDGDPIEYRWRSLRKFRNSILVQRHKVWLTPAAKVPCSNAANIAQNGRLGRKVNFAPGKIPLGGRKPRKCIQYSSPRDGKK